MLSKFLKYCERIFEENFFLENNSFFVVQNALCG